jgi:hypothetical protein
MSKKPVRSALAAIASFVTVTVTLTALTAPGTAAAQSIAGTITGAEMGAPPARDIAVEMLDAANGELLASALTNFEGTYNSGIIPVGEYRVRFNGIWFFRGEKAEVTDDFCSAAAVTVIPMTTTVVDQRMPGPVLVAGESYKGAVSGSVRDAATLSPLGGIRVTILDRWSAELVGSTTTDANGVYEFSGSRFSVDGMVRVRFSDPSKTFFPQFFGGAGADVFCAGTPVFLGHEVGEVDAVMNRVSFDFLTQELTETIGSFELPPSVDAMLSTPLTRLLDLVTDDNASNDWAACGQLTAFVSRVDVQEKRGQLSPAEAGALRASAANIAISLACH